MVREEIAFRNELYSWSEIHQVVRMSLLERKVMDVSNGLLSSPVGIRYDRELASRMISKLSRFIETTAAKKKFKQMDYHLEPYLDEVLNISFPRHEGLKLSLYFDQHETVGREDVEEAVIIHRSTDGLNMRSGSIEDMVVLLEEML